MAVTIEEDQHLKSESINIYNDYKEVKARTITQILAVVIVSFGSYLAGTTVVYPAVAIPSLKKLNETRVGNGTGLPFVLLDSHVSYIVSIASFGMLFGSLAGGPLVNLIGRKWTCIWGTCGNLAISYVLIASAKCIWMIHFGRFFAGSGMGFSTTVSTLYIMEIATPQLRGRLAVLPAIAGTLGVLTCQIMGAFLDWQMISWAIAVMNLPFLLLLLFIPETPVYLISTSQIERAHKVLRYLRGPDWNVTKELTDLKVASDYDTANSDLNKSSISDLFRSDVIKPFIITLFLMFFFQFSGINIILQYTVQIFEMAEIPFDKFIANIIVGVALLVSNTFTLLVVNNMRRRLMILISSFGISVTLVSMGTFFHLKDMEKSECLSNSSQEICPPIYTDYITWLPLALKMAYIFAFNLGYGALIWITVAEILPLRVRSVANSLSVGFTCCLSFVTSHSYNSLQESIGNKGVFWFYGVISFMGFIFIAAFVPETKNKSETEIQNYFRRGDTAAARKRNRKEQQKRDLSSDEAQPLKTTPVAGGSMKSF